MILYGSLAFQVMNRIASLVLLQSMNQPGSLGFCGVIVTVGAGLAPAQTSATTRAPANAASLDIANMRPLAGSLSWQPHAKRNHTEAG